MKNKKKREYNSSELVNYIVKKYQLEDGFYSIAIQKYFDQNWTEKERNEMESILFSKGHLRIKIRSTLFRNNLKMQTTKIMNDIHLFLEEEIILLLEFH